MKIVWNNDCYIKGITKNFRYTSKIAGFDLDSTLIEPKKGGFKYKDENDWKFMFDNVPHILEKLSKSGYCIIIITNQAGMEKKNDVKEDVWMKKINYVVASLNIDICIFCSKGHDKYRKPIPTFFNMIENDMIEYDIKINKTKSFYCGDACGRKNDHSDTDFKFAINCKLNFITPEKLFLGHNNNPPKFTYTREPYTNTNKEYNFIPNEKELIIMVGYPASGKSHTSKLIQNNAYVVINRDTLKTQDKCITKCDEAMKNNLSIVIDNTNPDKESRSKYIELAKKYNYKTRALIMTTSLELSKHNNGYRSYITETPFIPNIVYNIYSKKYQEPTINEGFDKIEKIEPSLPLDINYLYFFY